MSLCYLRVFSQLAFAVLSVFFLKIRYRCRKKQYTYQNNDYSIIYLITLHGICDHFETVYFHMVLFCGVLVAGKTLNIL